MTQRLHLCILALQLRHCHYELHKTFASTDSNQLQDQSKSYWIHYADVWVSYRFDLLQRCIAASFCVCCYLRAAERHEPMVPELSICKRPAFPHLRRTQTVTRLFTGITTTELVCRSYV